MRRAKRLPYEPKSIEAIGDTCCMRCNKHYFTEYSKNNVIIEDFWNYCSLKCALDDEISFEAFFASLENSSEENMPKNEGFYMDLKDAIKKHRDSIDIHSYINKAKKFKAIKLVKILKSIQ